MKLIGCLAAAWLGLFACCGQLLWVLDGASADAADVSLRNVLLTRVIDAEIHATQAYVALLKTKAALLQRVIQLEHAQLGTANESGTPASAVTNASQRQRPHLPRKQHVYERFDDWFPSQGVWTSGPERVDASAKLHEPWLHVEMISFRPLGNVGGKRSGHQARHGAHDPVTPTLQFLLSLDKQTGAVDIFHPATLALVWQQRLELPSPVTSVYFHSDRASHLLLTTQNGELLLYRMRVFHGRRLIAGDYRRVSGADTASCMYRVGLPRSLQASSLRVSPRVTLYDMLITSTAPPRTIAAGGFHIHFEIDFDFTTTPPRAPSIVTMVASHQSLHVVTAAESGQISFFHGLNGSLFGELATGIRGITRFQTLSSGVLALAAANRIHFVDVLERRLLDVTCQGSRHAITSMERDVWRHTVLYAGTSDGTGLAFRINRFGSIKRNRSLLPLGLNGDDLLEDSDLGFPSCTLTAVLQPHARIFDGVLQPRKHQPAVVTALPGYLLLTSGEGHLVLYDTNSAHPGYPKYLAEKSPASLLASASTRVLSVAAAKDLPHMSAAAVAVAMWEPTRRRVRVELLASRVPPPASSLEMGWLRAPMMLLCAFGVMFWQQNRFRRAPASASSLAFDLPAAARHRAMGGRGGHHDWARSTNHRARNAF